MTTGIVAAGVATVRAPGTPVPSNPLHTALKLQAGACRHFGSPLYADLLSAALDELGRDGPVERLLASWEGDPLRGFLPLRLMGAVHERVLIGAAPELARFYPSAGGTPRMPDAWRAFRDLVESQAEALRPRLERFPQTNEVNRCAALLPGFLHLASRAGLPLHLREIGASAGLNLHFDRYRYELGPHRWGGSDSPVCVTAEWLGEAAPFETRVSVASRAGCDIAPVPIATPDEALALECYVWADQPERLEQLRGAVSVARAEGAPVERASAAAWLEGELADLPGDGLTVVFHSSMWIYLSRREQRRIRDLLDAAAARGPLAWLRHEDERGDAKMELRARLWPAEDVLLARGHPHGRFVDWQLDP